MMKVVDDDPMDRAMNSDPKKNEKKPPKAESEEDRRKRDSEEEELDEALDETFPASDPVSPSRIDGP